MVLSIIKLCNYLSFIFHCAKKVRVVEKVESDTATLKLVTTTQDCVIRLRENIGLKILPILQWTFTCLSKKAIEAPK